MRRFGGVLDKSDSAMLFEYGTFYRSLEALVIYLLQHSTSFAVFGSRQTSLYYSGFSIIVVHFIVISLYPLGIETFCISSPHFFAQGEETDFLMAAVAASGCS